MAESKAPSFDVVGTGVDWRSSLIGEARGLGACKGIAGDRESFDDSQLAGSRPSTLIVSLGGLTALSLVSEPTA